MTICNMFCRPATYTLVVSDANYQPYAVLNSGGTLSDGFNDFTGGVFQTCDTDESVSTPTATTPWILYPPVRTSLPFPNRRLCHYLASASRRSRA